jgi:hypothetical protein
MSSIIVPSNAALPPIPRPPQPPPLSPGQWALAQLEAMWSGKASNRGGKSDQPNAG